MRGNTTGRFYGTPIESAVSPVQYSRVMIGYYNQDPKKMQFDFLSGLKHIRFNELQRMTGAYQGPGKLHQNQLLDAFHIWCAEHNVCDFFLTLDFKLIRVVSSSRNRTIRLVKPSELLKHLEELSRQVKTCQPPESLFLSLFPPAEPSENARILLANPYFGS
jgi:hypothetical protein